MGCRAVFSAERYRDLGNGESLLTTFTGRTSDSRYRRVAGAAHDGAAWVIDEKEIEYVRFSVERIEFDRGDVLTTEGTAGTRKKRRLF
jgi:hypothetical protein